MILEDKIESVFGSCFSTHGLGGILTCGVIGIKAGLSHSPIQGVSACCLMCTVMLRLLLPWCYALGAALASFHAASSRLGCEHNVCVSIWLEHHGAQVRFFAGRSTVAAAAAAAACCKLPPPHAATSRPLPPQARHTCSRALARRPTCRRPSACRAKPAARRSSHLTPAT